MVAEPNNHGNIDQQAHRGGNVDSTLTPLLFQEGFNIDHDGNLIATWHVDFKMPHERSPIRAVIKYSEEQRAIERCHTIKLTRPRHFRGEGETLIYDKNEGLATKEIVVREEVPISDDEQTRARSLNDDINRALELSGGGAVRFNTTPESRTVTNAKRDSLEWGNDLWVFCTAIEPTSEDERTSLLDALDPDYDHASYIPSPRTFAQMLARAYVEEYGPPDDEEKPMEHSMDGAFTGKTYHRQMIVIHGPVVYVDDPYATCTSAMDSQNPLIRTMLPIFVKGKDYSGQREYRFVISDKTEHEADWKIMPATPMLVAAIGRPGESKGPMVVPALDTTGAEPPPQPETTRPPQFRNRSMPMPTRVEMAELNAASSTIPEHHIVADDQAPPEDFHEAVGVYPAVATLHEKIDDAFLGIATTQSDRNPYVTSAAWYAERSIRKLCNRFENPIAGISITGDNSIVIDIQLSHWCNSECKLAVMPSGVFALTLKRKSGGALTTRFSVPTPGEYGMATLLNERQMEAIADFEPSPGQE